MSIFYGIFVFLLGFGFLVAAYFYAIVVLPLGFSGVVGYYYVKAKQNKQKRQDLLKQIRRRNRK